MGLVKKLSGFIFGVGLGFLVAACATEFPYKYYGLSLEDKTLKGPTQADDLSLDVCKASPSSAAPCIAMMSDAFLEMKKRYKDLQSELIACQQQQH
jgi:hypothetical protein